MMFTLIPEIIILISIVAILIILLRRVPNAAGVPLKASVDQGKLFKEKTIRDHLKNYFSVIAKRFSAWTSRVSKKVTERKPKTSVDLKAESNIGNLSKIETEVKNEPEIPVTKKKKKAKPPADSKNALTFEGSSSEEEKHLQRIVDNPKDIQAYKALAEVYARDRNYADAVNSLRQVLKISPNDIVAEEKLKEYEKNL